MGAVDFTQLGVAGFVALILAIAVKVLWEENKELRKQARDDQARVLPALTEASQALTDFARTATILLERQNRERG